MNENIEGAYKYTLEDNMNGDVELKSDYNAKHYDVFDGKDICMYIYVCVCVYKCSFSSSYMYQSITLH